MDEGDRIYAGELRKLGIAIPPEIPSYAWIPKSAMVTTLGAITFAGDGSMVMPVKVTFKEAFKDSTWIRVDTVIPTSNDENPTES